MCQWGWELIGTRGQAIEWAYPDLLTPKPGVKNFHFQIAAKRLEIDDNVKRAHLITHWLAVDAMNNRTVFI